MGVGVLVLHHAQGFCGSGPHLGVLIGQHVRHNGVEGIILADLPHAGNGGQLYLFVLVVGQLDESGLFALFNCLFHLFQFAHFATDLL